MAETRTEILVDEEGFHELISFFFIDAEDRAVSNWMSDRSLGDLDLHEADKLVKLFENYTAKNL